MSKAVQSHQLGMIPWYSYVGQNLSKAKDFYSQLFNYTIESFSAPGGPPVEVFKAADGMMFADLTPQADGPTHWTFFVVVENIDKTMHRVTQMGGLVLHPKLNIPSIGEMVRIQDPSGGSIWCYTPEDASRADWGSGANFGRVCWHELITPDPDKAQPFYAEIFNWKFKHGEVPGHDMRMINAAGKDIGHIMKTPVGATGMPPIWLTYFLTANLDETARAAVSHGAIQKLPKTEVPGTGWWSLFQDPAGALFYLWQPKR